MWATLMRDGSRSPTSRISARARADRLSATGDGGLFNSEMTQLILDGGRRTGTGGAWSAGGSPPGG
ncbi:hypothetical protein Psi01_69080 [Planobispora siamensis]|uniref:Uncharacterized protein n=1 Tax=Planobispora siamensis TaxID=936338 RepID=A0A8J3SKV9_9ACTN|nr:hypothetical protein Psi01_69080 [Planobispora siamensis]